MSTFELCCSIIICSIITGNTELHFKLVFESTTGANLWSVEAIKEMCSMEQNLVQGSGYANTNGCPGHSIGYYIGWIRNKECEELDEDDLSATLQVLFKALFKQSLSLVSVSTLTVKSKVKLEWVLEPFWLQFSFVY